MLEYMIEDLPEYRSRGERIMSVLSGSGSVDVLPGRPDVQASDSDFRKGESYNPPLDFDHILQRIVTGKQKGKEK